MAKFLHSKSFVILLLVFLVLFVIALGRESYRFFRVNQEIKDLEQRIVELEKSSEELAKMEEYFQSEEFLEKEARLKLNLTKPGEKVIIVKQPEGFMDGEGRGVAVEDVSNIQKWWNYFFKKEL